MSSKPATSKAPKAKQKISKNAAAKNPAPAKAVTDEKADPGTVKPAAPAATAATAKKTAPAKAAKPSSPAAKKGRGVRYTKELKQQVVDFVTSYNAKNGRGGQSAAARKFGVTILTVSSWLKGSGTSAKSAGAKPSIKVSAAPKTASHLSQKVKALFDLGDQIRKLQDQYAALSASIRSEL